MLFFVPLRRTSVVVLSTIALVLSLCLVSLSCVSCASTATTAASSELASESTETAQLGLVHDSQTLAPGQYALVVFGMSCPKCISNVDLQLGRVEGISNPKVDMKHGIVTIDVVGPAAPSREAIFRAILDAGFTLREIRALPQSEVER